jgi:hypothetical protein
VSVNGYPESNAPSYTYVYISRAQFSGDVPRELARIEAQARAYNSTQGIRGALVYMGGFFMQWLEGPQAAVTALAQRLRTDPRHRDFYELLAAPQPPVLTEDWTVCIAKRTETQDELLRRARSIVVRARKGGWTAADLIRKLVKPSDAQTEKRQAGAYRYSRVCVVATNSIWPSALIRHVADTVKVNRISRTWFNQPLRADEAALCEYVDVPMLRGTHMRISCMSGWLVPSPLFDLLNQSVQVLVMLFRSASVAATLEYAQNILGTRSMQRTQPIVIGVFSPKSTEIAAVFQEYAAQQGYQAKVVYSHLAEPTAVWEEILSAADQFFIEHEWSASTTTMGTTVFGQRAQEAPGAVALKPAPAAATPPAPLPAPMPVPVPPPPRATLNPPTPTSAPVPAPQAAPNPQASAPPEPFGPAATASTAAPMAQSASAWAQGLHALARRLFSAQPAVHAWAAWEAHELAQTADAPAELLHALEALRGKLAAGEPLEMVSQFGAGHYEWLFLVPAAAPVNTGLWLQVELREPDLNPGMVQYLASQWKEELARLASLKHAA